MRQNSAETVEWFKTACNSGDLSRTARAHEPCVQENRFGRVGRLCLASARKLLPHLAEQPRVGLPEAEAMEFAPHARPPSDFADSSVSCSLRELGPLSLERAAAPEARRRGSQEGRGPKKRGAKPTEPNPLSAKVHHLEEIVARLERNLATAHTIPDMQGNVAGLPAFSLNDGKDCCEFPRTAGRRRGGGPHADGGSPHASPASGYQAGGPAGRVSCAAGSPGSRRDRTGASFFPRYLPRPLRPEATAMPGGMCTCRENVRFHGAHGDSG